MLHDKSNEIKKFRGIPEISQVRSKIPKYVYSRKFHSKGGVENHKQRTAYSATFRNTVITNVLLLF